MVLKQVYSIKRRSDKPTLHIKFFKKCSDNLEEVDMRNIKIFNVVTFAIVLLLTLFCYNSVYADDTSLGRTPDGVFPLQENAVIMESEEITVDLEKNHVECIFVFRNTGKSKNVYIGFPGKLYDNRGTELTEDVNLELRHFKTFINGKELPVTREKSTLQKNKNSSETSEYSEFFTFTVPFKTNEKVTVRNTYDFVPTYDSMGYIFSGYVLKTGAMWKDSIGSAKVTFKLGKMKPFQIENLKPGGFRFVGNDLIWERKNFEPVYDLCLVYNDYRYSEEFLKDTTADEVSKIKEKINSFNKVNELAKDGKTDELLALYKNAVKEKASLLALYIRSYLPSDKIPTESSNLGNISIENNNDNYYINCDVLGPQAAIQLTISHTLNGKEIVDMQVDDTAAYFYNYTPGTEYIITYTLRDWMDRTDKKSLKYKVPVQAALAGENQMQPSNSVSTPTTSDSNIEPEAVNKSADKSVNNPINESLEKAANAAVDKEVNEVEDKAVNGSVDKAMNKKENAGSKLIYWVLPGAVSIGLLVISVVVLRKRHHT
jgi:hypothetical protein